MIHPQPATKVGNWWSLIASRQSRRQSRCVCHGPYEILNQKVTKGIIDLQLATKVISRQLLGQSRCVYQGTKGQLGISDH